MFSVVIPLYNKENSIRNTVQSVLNQSFADFEIVIVNDGSTDKSLEVVRQINDARIRIIDKDNGGVSSARNYGIKNAEKEWIAFLDGDDLWEPNHLEEYHKHTGDNVNWIISGYKSKNKLKEYIKLYNKDGKLENVFDDLLKGLKIHTSTVCIKKNNFDKNPDLYFREGINNSEDREVWYKMCCIDQSPFYIKQTLSVYCLDDPNSLTKGSTISKDDYLSLYDRIKQSDIFKNTASENKLKLKKYIDKFNNRAIKGYYLKNKRMKQSYKNYLSNKEWFLMNATSFLPELIKKVIVRL
jgi:glycosyltransferase involved in cell wall biosynthesis